MAGNNQYGKIQLSVRVDKKGVSSSLKAVEKDVASLASKGKQLANLGAQLRGLGEGVNRFGRRVAVAGALAKTGFLIATKQAGDFERSLASIKVNIGDRIKKDLDIAPTLTKSATTVGSAVSKINSEYKKLEATFKSIARQFPKGPLEIAGAGNQLARAGLSKNIIQGLDPKEAEKQSKLLKKKIEAGSGGILRPLVQLSVADTTGASLEEITDKAIKLLKAFDSLNNTDIRIAIESGDFEKARQLSDEMAKNVTRDFATILKASTQANVSVVSLAESLKFPGASLADVVKGDKTGKAFREVIAVTSILQERLGDASIAGTALRGMLQRLKKPPQEIAEQMYALGFSMDKMRAKSKNGSVGLLDMLKAIEAMKQQLKGGKATQGEFNDFVSGIFDNRQVSAALSLIDTSAKELDRRVEDLKIQGDPEEFFNQFEKILNNNVQGALGRTISAVQNLGLAIGDALSTPAQGALDSIAKLADRISNFVENNQDLVRGLALATAGLIAIGGAITFAGAAFSTIAITVIGAGLAMELFAKKGVMLDGLRKGVVSLTSAYKGLAAAQSLSAGMIPVAPVKNLAKAAPAAAAGLTAVSKAAGGSGAAVAGGSSVLTGFAGFQKKLGKNSIPGMAAFGAGKKLRNVGKVPPVIPQAVAPKAVQQGLFAASGAASFAPKMPILGPMKQMMLDFNSLAKNRSNLPRRGGVRGASATTAALAGLTLSKADNKLFANAAKNFGKGNKNWPKVTKRLEKIGVKGARGMSFKELKDVLKNLVANTSKSGAVAPMMMGTRGSKPIGAFGGDMRRRSAAATTKFGRSATTFVPGPSKATDAFFSRQRVRDFRKNRGFLGNALLRARGAARGAGLSKANLALIGSSIASGIRGNGSAVVGSLLSGQGRGPSAFRGAGAIAGAGLASAGRGLGTAAMTATVGFKAFGDVATLAIANVVKSVVKLAAGMVSLAGTAAVLGLSFSGALSASGEALDGLIANLARTREAFGKAFSTLGKVFASLKFDNLIPEESIGDRLSTLADTLKVGFKAIGTSVALEFGSAFLDLLTTIGKSIFMTFVNIGKNISAALFGGPGGEDSVGIVQSIENARQDAIDQLSQIAKAADERIKKGLERQAQLEAKFLGVAPEEGFTNDAVADLRKEFVQKLAKGEFGDSDSEEAIQKAGQSFKKAVEDLEKKDLIDFADGLRDKLETAGEKLKTQLETIALADERGALKPGERVKFESAAKEEFKSNSPIFKAAEEHMKAAEKLKEAGKSLTAKIDPRVSLDQRVKELSDLFASGAISLGTFRQAVEDAEFEESERLTALQKERAARGRGGAGASQVGSGTFFSKFNQLLGRGGQDETTIRKKVLTAQVDFLEIAKTALKTAGENLKNSDIGTAAQTAFENVKSAFDQPLANLMQAGTDLKEAAAKLLKGPEEEVKEPPVETEESVNRSTFPSPKKFETPVPQTFGNLDDPRKQIFSDIKPAGKVFQGQIDTSIGSASGKMQLDRFTGGMSKLDEIADGIMTKTLGVSSVNDPTVTVNVNLDGKKLMSSFESGGAPTEFSRMGNFGGFRANGGGVNRGKSYVVGERGPELFFPTERGHILSNGLSNKVDGMFSDGTNDKFMKKISELAEENKLEAQRWVQDIDSDLISRMADFSFQPPTGKSQNLGGMTKLSDTTMEAIDPLLKAGDAVDKMAKVSSLSDNSMASITAPNTDAIDKLLESANFKGMSGSIDDPTHTANGLSKKVDGMSSDGTNDKFMKKISELAEENKLEAQRWVQDIDSDLISSMADFSFQPPTGNNQNLGGMTKLSDTTMEAIDPLLKAGDAVDRMAKVSSLSANSMAPMTAPNTDAIDKLLESANFKGMLGSIDDPTHTARSLLGPDSDTAFGVPRNMQGRMLGARRLNDEQLADRRAEYLQGKEEGIAPRGMRRRMAQMQQSAMAAGGNRLVPDAAMNAMPNAAVDAGRVGAGAGNLQKADLEPLAKDATINELIGKVGELIGKVSTGGLME